MYLFESIFMALDSVRSNKLRSSLTLMSIAIGIFAIIGAGTLVSSLTSSITSELNKMGQTLFSIQKFPNFIMSGSDWRKFNKRQPITYKQALMLKDSLYGAENVSMLIYQMGAVQSAFGKTDPDVQYIGSDEHFLSQNSYDISEGRPLTVEDVSFSRRVCLVGTDVVAKLFPGISPLGKELTIKGHRFTIIGVTTERGAVFGKKLDNFVVIPVSVFMQYFTDQYTQSLIVRVRASDNDAVEPTVDKSIGLLRVARRLKPIDDNDFEVVTNEALTQQFDSFTKYVNMFGTASGIIALIAAGIGIMNIMLVTIKERTREIGVRKALGATKRAIMAQFIAEAITLCQLGGLIGILLGILAGVALSNSLDTQVSVPIDQIIFSVVVCTILGVTFGGYPAWKAAQLDPIESLRYE